MAGPGIFLGGSCDPCCGGECFTNNSLLSSDYTDEASWQCLVSKVERFSVKQDVLTKTFDADGNLLSSENVDGEFVDQPDVVTEFTDETQRAGHFFYEATDVYSDFEYTSNEDGTSTEVVTTTTTEYESEEVRRLTARIDVSSLRTALAEDQMGGKILHHLRWHFYAERIIDDKDLGEGIFAANQARVYSMANTLDEYPYTQYAGSEEWDLSDGYHPLDASEFDSRMQAHRNGAGGLLMNFKEAGRYFGCSPDICDGKITDWSHDDTYIADFSMRECIGGSGQGAVRSMSSANSNGYTHSDAFRGSGYQAGDVLEFGDGGEITVNEVLASVHDGHIVLMWGPTEEGDRHKRYGVEISGLHVEATPHQNVIGTDHDLMSISKTWNRVDSNIWESVGSFDPRELKFILNQVGLFKGFNRDESLRLQFYSGDNVVFDRTWEYEESSDEVFYKSHTSGSVKNYDWFFSNHIPSKGAPSLTLPGYLDGITDGVYPDDQVSGLKYSGEYFKIYSRGTGGEVIHADGLIPDNMPEPMKPGFGWTLDSGLSSEASFDDQPIFLVNRASVIEFNAGTNVDEGFLTPYQKLVRDAGETTGERSITGTFAYESPCPSRGQSFAGSGYQIRVIVNSSRIFPWLTTESRTVLDANETNGCPDEPSCAYTLDKSIARWDTAEVQGSVANGGKYGGYRYSGWLDTECEVAGFITSGCRTDFYSCFYDDQWRDWTRHAISPDDSIDVLPEYNQLTGDLSFYDVASYGYSPQTLFTFFPTDDVMYFTGTPPHTDDCIHKYSSSVIDGFSSFQGGPLTSETIEFGDFDLCTYEVHTRWYNEMSSPISEDYFTCAFGSIVTELQVKGMPARAYDCDDPSSFSTFCFDQSGECAYTYEGGNLATEGRGEVDFPHLFGFKKVTVELSDGYTTGFSAVPGVDSDDWLDASVSDLLSPFAPENEKLTDLRFHYRGGSRTEADFYKGSNLYYTLGVCCHYPYAGVPYSGVISDSVTSGTFVHSLSAGIFAFGDDIIMQMTGGFDSYQQNIDPVGHTRKPVTVSFTANDKLSGLDAEERATVMSQMRLLASGEPVYCLDGFLPYPVDGDGSDYDVFKSICYNTYEWFNFQISDGHEFEYRFKIHDFDISSGEDGSLSVENETMKWARVIGDFGSNYYEIEEISDNDALEFYIASGEYVDVNLTVEYEFIGVNSDPYDRIFLFLDDGDLEYFQPEGYDSLTKYPTSSYSSLFLSILSSSPYRGEGYDIYSSFNEITQTMEEYNLAHPNTFSISGSKWFDNVITVSLTNSSEAPLPYSFEGSAPWNWLSSKTSLQSSVNMPTAIYENVAQDRAMPSFDRSGFYIASTSDNGCCEQNNWLQNNDAFGAYPTETGLMSQYSFLTEDWTFGPISGDPASTTINGTSSAITTGGWWTYQSMPRLSVNRAVGGAVSNETYKAQFNSDNKDSTRVEYRKTMLRSDLYSSGTEIEYRVETGADAGGDICFREIVSNARVGEGIPYDDPTEGEVIILSFPPNADVWWDAKNRSDIYPHLDYHPVFLTDAIPHYEKQCEIIVKARLQVPELGAESFVHDYSNPCRRHHIERDDWLYSFSFPADASGLKLDPSTSERLTYLGLTIPASWRIEVSADGDPSYYVYQPQDAGHPVESEASLAASIPLMPSRGSFIGSQTNLAFGEILLSGSELDQSLSHFNVCLNHAEYTPLHVSESYVTYPKYSGPDATGERNVTSFEYNKYCFGEFSSESVSGDFNDNAETAQGIDFYTFKPWEYATWTITTR